MGQEQIRRVERTGEEVSEFDEKDAQKIGETALKGEKLNGEIDDLLDSIDEVLESNAEEFVREYIQKGGQ